MKIRISTVDLVFCISEAIDLISPLVANHHKYVACIAYQICCELGLSETEQMEITFAAALHDVGALTLESRLNALIFDGDEKNDHTEKGYLLLNSYKPFSNIARYIRYHHTMWKNGNCVGFDCENISIGSHIIHLADRIAVMIKPDIHILSQADEICQKISNMSGDIFAPELVKAFISISKKECFWLDIISDAFAAIMENQFRSEKILKKHNFFELIKLFSRVIDFRSRFTALHSSGVAACAKSIAKIAGFSVSDCETMEIAGLLHDIGKLAIPSEILEKPGKLTKEENDIIRSHTYYTNLILSKVKEFDTIRMWGALHHERLNGKGYPFHYDSSNLSLGSRMMAVADVFVALTEDRPYRIGMQKDEAISIMEKMANSLVLDIDIFNLVKFNYEAINNYRIKAQNKAKKEYNLLK